MGVKLMFQHESNSVIDKPAVIPFEFSNVPEGKSVGDKIIVRPITVHTWFRLKPYFIHIEKEDINLLTAKDDVKFDDDVCRVISKYDELLFEIICIGIHNKPGDMPEWFKSVLKDSCTWEDIFILFNAIVYRLGTTSFLNTIIAAAAVSPLGEEEIIALQENKESWTSKAALPSLFR